ncbi:MAG: CHRD domain-containing protein [Planctomycetes bacterium]|nr:CHRD domain-containing protein [Planctomycetota bacterium]
MSSRNLGRSAAFLLVAALLPACKFNGFFVPFSPVTVNAELRGSQVVPATATPSTGTAVLTVSGSRTSIDYSVTYAGAGVITSVEIRIGIAGSNGPVIFTLTSAPFVNPLTGTLNSTNLTLQPGAGVMNFGDAIDKILNGGAYILISTATSLTGEIRGQLGAAVVASAVLSGAQEVPPVAGTGSGTLTAAFDSTQGTIVVTTAFTGLTSATTAAHIHAGAAGVGGGPIVFNLSLVAFTSPLTVTLTSVDFLPGGGLVTYADAVNAFLSGTLYVNIHTVTNGGGEIRGQIGPAHLTSALDGLTVVPANSSTATGTASVVLNALQTEATVSVTHNVTAPTSVLIHADDPGFNGPQIFDVDAVAGSAASPANAVLKPIHLIPAPAKGIVSFSNFVNALLTSKTYVDVGSAGFPFGEIRGQIIP